VPARPGTQAPAFSYFSTPALRRVAAVGYVERVTRNKSAAVAATSPKMGRKDFGKIYAEIVAPFGYRPVDALAVYTLAGWLIASGQA